MRGRFFFVVLLVGIAACRRAETAPSGHLEITGPDLRVVNGPAKARWCSADSILTILALGGDWNVALAMRTPWPPLREFAIDSTVQGAGTGAIAARAARDSVSPPLLGLTGTVSIDSGDTLKGTLAIDVGPDSARRKLTGRFSGLVADSSGCARP